MGRHSATLPPARRHAGIALGAGTLVVLALTLWQVAVDEPTPPPSTLAATAFDTTTVRRQSPTTAITTAPSTSAVPATTQPPTTTVAPFPLSLQSSGVGVVELGAVFADAHETVTELLGPPDTDTGWINAVSEEYGTCPGTVIRVVRWASLRLFFSDGPSEFGEDERHFFYYSQSLVDTGAVLDLTTTRGIGVGSSVADLEAAYGETVEIDSSIRFGVTFVVRSGRRGLLAGTLSDSTPEGQVTSITGGFGCGSS